MKCGKCHEDHESVQQVRDCYSGTYQPKAAAGTASQRGDHRPNRYAGPCGIYKVRVEAKAGHIEKVQGKWTVFHNSGDCVSRIPAQPERQPYPQVKAGHYAVPSLTGNNDLDFFRVDRPTDGPYRGRTFVKRIIGGRPSVAVRGVTARQALEAILAFGEDKATTVYGQEIGRCGKCNRHLTDETSRARGIGPDCWAQGYGR